MICWVPLVPVESTHAAESHRRFVGSRSNENEILHSCRCVVCYCAWGCLSLLIKSSPIVHHLSTCSSIELSSPLIPYILLSTCFFLFLSSFHLCETPSTRYEMDHLSIQELRQALRERGANSRGSKKQLMQVSLT